MEVFEDKTNSGKEPAVKVGNSVPKDAVNIAWYSSKEVSPRNNISIVDLSGTIPENINENQSASNLMYANELGILEDEFGNPYVSSDDIYVSDVFLNEETYAQEYSINNLAEKHYAMTYYVSKYFTLLRTKYFDTNSNSYVKDEYIPSSIKVLDKNGNLYSDPATGRLKYRIFFESFLTKENVNQNEIPHKIVVYLQDIDPGDLTLVYDKVEVDQYGQWAKQVLRHSEPVNYIPVFKKIEEETEVIDRSRIGEKVFSVKRDTKSNSIKNRIFGSDNNIVYVNKKAIDDNRIFEIFNWRVVAKIKNSVNFNTAFNNRDSSSDSVLSKTVNVGVLYSSKVGKDYSKISPYVFANLASSTFNLSSFDFVNPNATTSGKGFADYWLVDIDTISGETLAKSYDVLACSLHWKLDDSQGGKIKEFLNNAGTIIIDAVNAPADGLQFLDSSLSITQAGSANPAASPVAYNSNSLFINSSKNNAFGISVGEFADNCGIYGYGKTANNTFKKYNYFANTGLENILSHGSEKIFALLRTTRKSDRLLSSNIVVTTTGMLKYCNDIYSGAIEAPIANNGPSNAFRTIDSSVFSNFVEGPYKFLYNCVAVGLNDKIESTRIKQDLRSSVHVFSGQWNSDWVINSDAASEEEKTKYFKNTVVNSVQKYVREIITNPKVRYRKEISEIGSSISDVFLDQNESNIDIFIEYTNPNIYWTNSSAVSSTDKADLSSTYEIVKITNTNVSCDAYTDVVSPSFYLPSTFGSYVIKEKSIPTRKNALQVLPSTPPKSYPLDLKVTHYSVSGDDTSPTLDATVNVEANVEFYQKYTRTTTTTRRVEASRISARPYVAPTPGATRQFHPSSFESSQSGKYNLINKSLSNISDLYNAFNYTYDMDYGNGFDELKKGSKAEYVRYIQLTLTAAGYATTVDGIFGTNTENRVKQFQTSQGIKSDGIVDSQTKSYLANVWKQMPEATRNAYIANINKGNYGNKFIDKYITGAMQSTNAIVGLENKTGFRLINFTGISGSNDPSAIRVWIGFQLPNNANTNHIESITIAGQNFGTRIPSPAYQGFKIIDVNIRDQYFFNIANQNNYNAQGYSKTHTINIPHDPSLKGKYVSILLEGSKLGGNYGSTCEGIQIDAVYCTERAIGNPGQEAIAEQIFYKDEVVESFAAKEVKVSGVVSLSIPKKDISFGGNVFDIDAKTIKELGALKSITVYLLGNGDITQQTKTYTGLNVSLNNKEYKPDANRGEIVDISLILDGTVSVTSSVIAPGSVKKEGGTIVYDDSYVNLSRTNNTITLTSNISQYTKGPTHKSEQLIQGYFTTNPLKSEIKPSKNSFNYYDGVVLFCNQNGDPYTLQLASVSSAVSQDRDVYYSDIQISNTIPDQPGIMYGFYDINSKEFLGKSITYSKYQELGPKNIYIAAYAYDYDGNLNTQKEFSGSANGDNYIPTSVPTKMAYPVYKVASVPKNKIQITGIPQDLQKTEMWPLFVSSGSFTKEITLNLTRPKGWHAAYNNQKLTAIYDTSSVDNVAWSKVFGRGYYDVEDETPIIVSSRSIKLRRTPVVVVHEYPSNLVNFCGQFREIVNVYTRTSINSAWTKVQYSAIKSINKQTGIIEFINSIVPSDENLIKVNYTIEQKDISVIGSSNNPIPTNPFLFKDDVKVNKPLYIYLMPKEIYKSSNNVPSGGIGATVMGRSLVTEYTPGSLVNFTYDNNIFNPQDLPSYNPFAILIGIVYVVNTFSDDNFDFTDLRVKGGGISANFNTNKVLSDVEEAISYWDVYPALGEAYPKGGYVIIKIPSEVKKNFKNHQEVYDIVRRNLTAGIAFELQDMDGNEWSASVTSSS